MVDMNEWKRMNKWVITRVESDEVIMTYDGSFMDVMNFVNGRYEDGTIDIESYENWLNRQQKGNANEYMSLWLLVGGP